MKVSKKAPRPICACGNPRCPLPRFRAILKIGRRLSKAAAAGPSSPTLSAA